jgi:hypothetical protein
MTAIHRLPPPRPPNSTGHAKRRWPARAALGQQVLPLLARQAAAIEVRARPFATMIEEALVVVGGLQGRDLGVDERVEFAQVIAQIGRELEVHAQAPRPSTWPAM